MKSLSNIKIGKKIALVLGAIVLVLAGLSALSLWGTHTNDQINTLMYQRLTKARLAEDIIGDTAAIALNTGNMIIERRVIDDNMNRIAARRKSRKEEIDLFQK